uniref:Putative secreted protein n=1 Tax=Ixodes ricinus TaxID=34613 RepID=A0A6B0URJ5_IXORI
MFRPKILSALWHCARRLWQQVSATVPRGRYRLPKVDTKSEPYISQPGRGTIISPGKGEQGGPRTNTDLPTQLGDWCATGKTRLVRVSNQGPHHFQWSALSTELTRSLMSLEETGFISCHESNTNKGERPAF